MRIHAIWVVILFLILASLSTQAQTKMEIKIASELMCPCPDCVHILEPCECSVASELKQEIGQWLQEGKTEAAILGVMVERYGPEVLAKPRSLVAWVMPFVGIALGMAIVAYVLRKLLTARRSDPATKQVVELERYQGQIEREVEQYRRKG